MENSLKKNPIFNARYVIMLLLLVNTAAWAEISSLSAEELTDTYIQDTTVFVRQQKNQQTAPSVAVKLKVTPTEQATQVLPEDQAHTLSVISHELSTYDDLNNQRALDSNLAPQLPIATTIFLKDPASEDALTLIRGKYGLAQGVIAGQPIDLTTLTFLPSLLHDNLGDIPKGSSYQTTANSFTITIPNDGNFNTQQIASPNGEIGVNVTPSQIEYTVNLPK